MRSEHEDGRGANERIDRKRDSGAAPGNPAKAAGNPGRQGVSRVRPTSRSDGGKRAHERPLFSGAKVRLKYDPTWTGKILVLGAEVSEVRGDTNKHAFFVINRVLELTEDK